MPKQKYEVLPSMLVQFGEDACVALSQLTREAWATVTDEMGENFADVYAHVLYGDADGF